MRHVVIVCLLFLLGAGGLLLQADSSIRIAGGLGELATKTLRAHGVEVKQDGVFTFLDTRQKEPLVRALCITYESLGRERDIAEHNLANAKTTKTENGEPFRRQLPIFGDDGSFQGVVESQADFNWVYNPAHPDAMKEGSHAGYVPMPNVNPVVESQTIERVETERKLLRALVHRIDPELVFVEEPLGLLAAPQTAAERHAAMKRINESSLEPSTQQHFNLQLPPEPLPTSSLQSYCVKQSNQVSCGQASVAVALNYLSGGNLDDQDIDEHYGFQLLDALKNESPPGISWGDAGNLREESWPLISATLKLDKLPVIVAYAGKTDPTNRGTIVTLLDIEGELVTYADPLTGTLKTTSKNELLGADSHPDGNFIFLPSRVPVRQERNPSAEMGKPLGLSGLL